jgi:glycosyltransferase involved in cell wall biosynthesis
VSLGPDLVNVEGRTDYDAVWPWHRDAPMVPGTTAVLRVRNEARSLPFVLPALLRACQALVLVDNRSDDGTPDVALRVARDHGADDRLTVTPYPFTVSRCGPEHLHTPVDSVHSLAYFYNWSFAQVRTSYSLKWDGDMVLTRDGEELLADLAWQLPGREVVLSVPRHSLYVESDAVAYLDLGFANAEPYGYPMGPAYLHVKAFEWELRLYPDQARHVRLPEGSSVELKWLDSDEFAHWTSPDAFAGSARTRRKRREYELFTDLAAGRWDDQPGLRRIEAPEGVHVVDHVTQTWLPRAPRPLVDRSIEEPRAGAA